MSVLDRVRSRFSTEDFVVDEDFEDIEIPFTADEVTEVADEVVEHYEAFVAERRRLGIAEDSKTYEEFKRQLSLVRPNRKGLRSRSEIALTMGKQVGSLYKYIRLYDFEAAYLAASAEASYLVLLPDGSGNLLLKPEHRQVLDNLAERRQYIRSMESRNDAREYASRVLREGQ